MISSNRTNDTKVNISDFKNIYGRLTVNIKRFFYYNNTLVSSILLLNDRWRNLINKNQMFKIIYNIIYIKLFYIARNKNL